VEPAIWGAGLVTVGLGLVWRVVYRLLCGRFRADDPV